MRSAGGGGIVAAVFGLVVPGLLAAVTMPGVVAGGAALAAASSPAWRVVPSPDLAGWDSLVSVSASSPRDVWAVGTVEARPGGPSSPLVEHWDGRMWRITPVARGAYRSASLAAVSAYSTADAWAVGLSQSSHGPVQQPLAEHWDGRSWAAAVTPALPDGAKFNAVADLGPGNVWAVGQFPAQVAPYSHTLVEHFDGRAWHVVPSPDPGTMTDALWRVAASGPDDIWATGERAYSVPVLTLAERWDGRRWQVVPTPNDPAAQFNEVASLAAGSATDAWAAISTAGSSYGNFFAHWNGKTWQKVPGLTGIHLQLDLTGLAIASPAQAWAAGPFPNHGTLIAHWDGTHWRRAVTPDPSRWANVLDGITAVPGSNELFAVGYRQNKGSLGQTLVLASGLPSAAG